MTAQIINKYVTSAQIRRGLADKMCTAVFAFDKTALFNITDLSEFWVKLVFTIPDYAGVENTVFVGIAPTGTTNFTYVSPATGIVTGSQQLKAYDYGYYLTTQFLPGSFLVLNTYVPIQTYALLNWTDQQAITSHTFRLNFKIPIDHYPQVGDRIVGATSGDSGTVVATGSFGPGNCVYLTAISGSAPYFQDSEDLKVTGIYYCKADGAAVDISGSPPIHAYPDSLVNALLGADYYATFWLPETGIYPYRILAPSNYGWGTTLPETQFIFSQQTTKLQAIEQMCQYMKWIFYVKWKTFTTGGVTYTDQPVAYFIPESLIDDGTLGLDLPAYWVGSTPYPIAVTSTWDYQGALNGRKYLVSPFTLTQAGENQYNFIIVRCQSLTGAWYQKHEMNGNVHDPALNPTGTIIRRMYYEENANIATQVDCDARAADLASYYFKQINTWKATFRLRSDFVLLQRLDISGYSPAIADGTYRIIDIEYNYDQGGIKNEVTISIILDTDFKAYLNLKRVYLNSVFEVQNVVQNMLNQVANHSGIVVSVSGTTPGQTVVVLIDGGKGTQYRVNDPSGALAVNNHVIVTIDPSNGLPMASKIA